MSAEDNHLRWDRCAAHAIKSIGIGTILGLLASTLIFKRKRWAFLFGTSYGMGMAISGCNYELNERPECIVDDKSQNKGGGNGTVKGDGNGNPKAKGDGNGNVKQRKGSAA